MTSLGFEKALDPYKPTPAEIACVLRGECFITELDIFTRPIVNIKKGSVIGYKYFDFGDDHSSSEYTLALKTRGQGCYSRVDVVIDDPDSGEVIGSVKVGLGDGVYKGKVKALTGRHSVFFKVTHETEGWTAPYFDSKSLFELLEFTFMK